MEFAGDLPQGVIDMREVVECHVANEGAANLIVARAAVQPTEKKEQLNARGDTGNDPIGVHGSPGMIGFSAADYALKPNESPPAPKPMRNPPLAALRALASSN